MTRGLADRLVRAISMDKSLIRLLSQHWDESIGTNALKLWLIRQMRHEGRFFCCHFRGSLKGLGKEKEKLANEVSLFEIEYLLDLIAFDRGHFQPSFGAEVEWSYSKKRSPGTRDRILQHSGIRSDLVIHQKDVEFYYDFSRILAVRPRRGVFVGGSYYDQDSIERWRHGFEALLTGIKSSDIDEICVLFLLNVPRESEQRVIPFQWKPGQGNSLQPKGEIVLQS